MASATQFEIRLTNKRGKAHAVLFLCANLIECNAARRSPGWGDCTGTFKQLVRMCLQFLGETPDHASGESQSLHTPLPELIILQRNVPQAVWNGENLLVIQPKTLLLVDHGVVIRQVQWVTNPMTWLHEDRGLLEATRSVG
jgi:hypothetical protein